MSTLQSSGASTVEPGLSYADRLAHLRAKKEAQTQEKMRRVGYMNEDDYGLVLPPEGFDWQPPSNHPNGSFYGLDGWSRVFCSLMDCHPVYVDPMDALAGRYMYLLNRMRKSNWPPEYSYDALKPEQERYGIIHGIGNDAHFAPDYRIGLELGWGGLLEKVRRCRHEHGPDKAAFFQAEEDVIVALQGWIRRTVVAIEEAETRETNATLRENLHDMAEVNRWLIDGAPRTLRDACQWLAWFNMASRTYNRDGAGGQLDALLWPYYERDLREGRIDDEGTIFLLACLLLNDTRYYQLGGPDPQGRDQTNRLSFLILEAAHRLGTTCNLTIRVHDGLDPRLLRRGVEILLQDRKGCPRFSGDKALVEGFMRNGYTAELARQRIAVGCNWMALPGLEYTMNDTVKINVAKTFTVAFEEMMASGVEPSVAELWRRLEDHLRRAVLCTARGIDHQLDHQHLNEPELMLNLLTHGPIERGLNVTNGGVDLYNMCIDGAGLATVADSLAALEQRIDEQHLLTWAEIAAHLKNNYQGPQGERVRLMMSTGPHYGDGGSLGDRWALRLSELLTRLVKHGPTPGGRNLIPGWFSWADTIRLGRQVGATPDGRRAGEPISHGANPRPGFRTDGAATAMVKAVAAVQPGYGNTAPIQLELDPGVANTDDAVDIVRSLITTHFQLGGTLFNINIVDADRLLAAHKDPSKFPDLVVRVTGFTAYFASLSPEFRQLVVDRITRG
jgi:formate C-acetyltransferase